MQVGLPPLGGCILDPSIRRGSPPSGLTGFDPEQPPLASASCFSKRRDLMKSSCLVTCRAQPVSSKDLGVGCSRPSDRTLVITLRPASRHLQFTKKETKPQRSWVTSLRPHKQRGAGVLWAPKSCTSSHSPVGRRNGQQKGSQVTKILLVILKELVCARGARGRDWSPEGPPG